MGLLLPQVEYVVKMCVQNKIRDSVVSLGNPDIFVTETQYLDLLARYEIKREHGVETVPPLSLMRARAVWSNAFFSALSFNKIDYVDIAGGTIVADLNKQLEGIDKYQLVIDSGVMEHVFDVRSVFRNMTDLLEVGGFAIHIMISNNTMDHGFYQFSPTLFRDYYLANKYRIVDITCLEVTQDKHAPVGATWTERWRNFQATSYDPYTFSGTSFGQLSNSSIWYTMACVQKTSESLRDVAPYQYAWQSGARVQLPF